VLADLCDGIITEREAAGVYGVEPPDSWSF
jgi:hypothetical protein